MEKDEQEQQMILRKLAIVGIAGNVFLAAFKMFAGILGHSTAMISDAVHTLSDIVATIIAFVGVALSRKEADWKHPYGHDRFESVASILLAIILFGTGSTIGMYAVKAIVTGSYKEMTMPGVAPVVAAIASIIVKEAMFWYTMYYAKRLNSGAFKADAWHHRSDALSSIGALVGIIGTRHGILVLDQVAAIVISIMIMIVSIRIFRDAIEKMLDTSCDESYEKELCEFVLAYVKKENYSIGIDLLRTRKFGEKIYIEMEINADGNMPLRDAHEIAEKIHNAIEKEYPNVKHVMIHMNPTGHEHEQA